MKMISPTTDPPLAVCLVTPHQHADYRSLVTAMHSLVLDQKHPVELVENSRRDGMILR